MICGDKRDVYDWFPESFMVSEKRLRETMFEGRQGMKAPPEVAGAEFKQDVNGCNTLWLGAEPDVVSAAEYT